jgi:Flp pilus assembly protein TadG
VVEAVVGVPAFLLFLALILLAGRVAVAKQAVQAAANDAARAASITRTQSEAAGAATSSASATLANQGLTCTQRRVAVDTSGFTRPPGTPATVAATVTCAVALSDLALPGVPGSTRVTATVRSPLDTYRER